MNPSRSCILHRCAALCAVAVLLPAVTAVTAGAHPTPARSTAPSPAGAVRFTENRGQLLASDGRTRSDILYVADASGARLYFMRDRVSFVFRRGGQRGSPRNGGDGEPASAAPRTPPHPAPAVGYRMDLRFIGSDAAAVRGEDPLAGCAHFYLAHCPGGITGVRSFGAVVYDDIYPGIDLVFRASGGRVKYEFVVHPGGRVSDIRLRYDGATAITLDSGGNLAVTHPLGGISEEAPRSYQQGRAVASRFLLEGSELRFGVGDHDATADLRIDPWATYCGGSSDEEFWDVATDALGNVYAAGWTESYNFPVANAFQQLLAGDWDLMVVKYSPLGVLQWATYYGGSSTEAGWDLAIAASPLGQAVVVSDSWSSNFPTSQGAFQTVYAGNCDAVLVAFDINGTRLWATYFGDTGTDYSTAAAFSGSGEVLLGGCTTSTTNFPIKGGWQSTYAGGAGDGFVAKFDAGGQPSLGGYVGGDGLDWIGCIAASPTDNIIVGGFTNSSNFPISAGAFQSVFGGGLDDAFISVYDAGGGMLWSTLYGGGSSDHAQDVAADGSGNILMTGYTSSANFPTANAFQSAPAGGTDAFIVKWTPTGSRVWATCYGGGGSDRANGVAVTGGDLYITGSTASGNLPVQSAYQPALCGGHDAYLARFSSSCALVWATFYGGASDDYTTGVAVGSNGDPVICGGTTSSVLPLLSPQQPLFGGVGDAFAASFSASGSFPVALAMLAGRRDGADVVLDWRTESETDNLGFAVERSAGSGPWERRGFVAGAGTSALPREYGFRDVLSGHAAAGSALLYRLRQIDTDGREWVSPVLRVDPPAPRRTQLVCSPNPFARGTELRFTLAAPRRVVLRIVDLLGRNVGLLAEEELRAGSHAFAWDASALPGGMYFGILRAGPETSTVALRRFP